MLIGGYDNNCGPSLYYLDYLSALRDVNYGVQGAAGNFVQGLLDEEWRKDLSKEDVIKLMRRCLYVLYTRGFVNHTRYIVKIVSQDGVENVTDQFNGLRPPLN